MDNTHATPVAWQYRDNKWEPGQWTPITREQYQHMLEGHVTGPRDGWQVRELFTGIISPRATGWCAACGCQQSHHGDPDCIHLHLCDVCNGVVDDADSNRTAGPQRVALPLCYPARIIELEECRKRGWNDSAPAYRAGWNDCCDSVASIITPHSDVGALREQADAWNSVVETLNNVSLGWQFNNAGTGMECACAAIKSLADAPSSRDEQVWEMKQRACRAHALVNDLRIAHPEIAELGDDGSLHEAIHDILRVETPTAAPAQAVKDERELQLWRDEAALAMRSDSHPIHRAMAAKMVSRIATALAAPKPAKGGG